MFVLILPVSGIFNLKSEFTRVENIIEILIGIMCVSNVQIVFELYSECDCISS